MNCKRTIPARDALLTAASKFGFNSIRGVARMLAGGGAGSAMMEVKKRAIEVHALWDEEAGVWSAESENLPGLVTEADSYQLLMQKLQVMVPELLSYSPDLSQQLGPEIHLVLERNFTA
jgi:hypothetical protein